MMTKVEIELEALKTERSGMEAANMVRQHRGEESAYGSEAFFRLAERMRDLIPGLYTIVNSLNEERRSP